MGAGHDNLAHQANTVVPVQLRSSLRVLDHVVNDHASAAQRVAANGCSTAAVVKPEALLLHTSEVFPPRAKDEGIVSAVANNTTSLFKKRRATRSAGFSRHTQWATFRGHPQRQPDTEPPVHVLVNWWRGSRLQLYQHSPRCVLLCVEFWPLRSPGRPEGATASHCRRESHRFENAGCAFTFGRT